MQKQFIITIKEKVDGSGTVNYNSENMRDHEIIGVLRVAEAFYRVGMLRKMEDTKTEVTGDIGCRLVGKLKNKSE